MGREDQLLHRRGVRRAGPRLRAIPRKGSRVFVDAELDWREWTDQQENKREAVTFKARQVLFEGTRPSTDAATDQAQDVTQAPTTAAATASQPAPVPATVAMADDGAVATADELRTDAAMNTSVICAQTPQFTLKGVDTRVPPRLAVATVSPRARPRTFSEKHSPWRSYQY